MDLESGTRRSQVSLWNLPEELRLCILKSLHIKDVLNMRAVNSIFRDMIDDCSAVWKAASFHDTWPSSNNVHYFEKAAKFGNMEALLKMAIAYMQIMPQGDDWGINTVTAAELLCQVETMTPFEPFTWLFAITPCHTWDIHTKLMVMVYMKNSPQMINKHDAKKLNVCVAKILLSTNADEIPNTLPFLREWKADEFLSTARQLGSGCAAFLLWQMEYRSILSADRARKIESMRQLRDIARMGHLDSKLLLCKMYANGVYGGITPKQAAMFVRELAQSTTPANTQEFFKISQEESSSSGTAIRYFLVNRLIDIAVEKNYSGHTLYTAVSVVDRYLKRYTTPWSKLMLVGASAMLLCSRFLEKDGLTPDEARFESEMPGFAESEMPGFAESEMPGFAESEMPGFAFDTAEVVRMMGEITAALKGNIRVPNSLDFMEIFSSVAELDNRCSCLAEYVCELTLLNTEMGQFSPAEIAASSVLFARLLIKLDVPWPDKMVEFSGFTIENIRHCVFHMHSFWHVQRNMSRCTSVSWRYAEEKFHKVSEIPVMSYEELCYGLGM